MAAKLPEDLYKVIVVDTPDLTPHAILWFMRERREWLRGRYVSCQWDVDALLAKKQEVIDGDKLKVRLSI